MAHDQKQCNTRFCVYARAVEKAKEPYHLGICVRKNKILENKELQLSVRGISD